jgi:hypothetical protein
MWHTAIFIAASGCSRKIAIRRFPCATPIVKTARDRAFDLDAEVRFKLKHDVPIFNRPFRDVAEEDITTIGCRANNGAVSVHRVNCLKNWVRRENGNGQWLYIRGRSV